MRKRGNIRIGYNGDDICNDPQGIDDQKSTSLVLRFVGVSEHQIFPFRAAEAKTLIGNTAVAGQNIGGRGLCQLRAALEGGAAGCDIVQVSGNEYFLVNEGADIGIDKRFHQRDEAVEQLVDDFEHLDKICNDADELSG